MLDYLAIDTEFLTGLFDELREWEHPVYALLYGLPREDFYILRTYDRRRGCETYRRPGYMLSLSEFLENAALFDPQDEYTICFAGIGDAEGDEPPKTEISLRIEATVRELTELFEPFLESYCEKCLRADAPFRLTEEVVARCGFTAEDLAVVGEQVERCNAAAAARLQAEYDALKGLACIAR